MVWEVDSEGAVLDARLDVLEDFLAVAVVLARERLPLLEVLDGVVEVLARLGDEDHTLEVVLVVTYHVDVVPSVLLPLLVRLLYE